MNCGFTQKHLANLLSNWKKLDSKDSKVYLLHYSIKWHFEKGTIIWCRTDQQFPGPGDMDRDWLHRNMGEFDKMMELFYTMLLVVEWLYDFCQNSYSYILTKINFNIHKLCFNKKWKIFIYLLYTYYMWYPP